MKMSHLLWGVMLAGTVGMAQARAQDIGVMGCTVDEERQVAAHSLYVETALKALRRSFTHISPDTATRLENIPSEKVREALLSEKDVSSADEAEFRKSAASMICKFTTKADRRDMEAFYATTEGRELLEQQFSLFGRVMAFQQLITKLKLASVASKLP